MKKYCFDIDGVICNTKKNYYSKAKPNRKAIQAINKLYKKNLIILFTARYMGRSKENPNLAKKKASKLTIRQMKKWGVRYHKIIFGKPSYDLVVDDKSIFFNKNWWRTI